jgi:hypothetical protein
MSTATLNIYGNYSVVAATIFSDTAAIFNFAGTSGTQTITTNGTNIPSYVQFIGAGTYQLQDNFIANSGTNSRQLTFTSGTLDLNDKQLSCQFWSSNNTNVRSLSFGTIGKIVLLGTRTVGSYVVWQMTTTTNFSLTGTAVVDFTNTNGVNTTHIFGFGTVSEANTISINIKSGVLGTVSLFGGSLGNVYKNIDFTGFTGSLGTHTFGGSVIYGNWTFSTGMTVATTVANTAITFSASSGTQIITSSGKSFECPLTFDSAGATFKLADALSLSTVTSRVLTLANGTFDGDSKTITGTGSSISSTGTVTAKNISTALAFTLTSGTLTFGAANTTGAYTLTSGTLNLAGYQLNCPSFSSSNSNTRTIAFGSGNITCTSSGTAWTTATPTGMTVTGTPVANITNATATATTVLPGILTEAQAISFNFTAGTYALTFLSVVSYSAKSVNFTGFAGTWSGRTVAATIYGSLTLSTGMTFAASTGILTLGATSGTQIITTNAKTLDQPLNQNGVGGTVQLADALAMGTRALTLTNGTFDGGGYSITGSAAITMITGSVTAKNINTARAITHTSGTLTFGANNTTGAYTFSAGTLDLAGYQLNPSTFTSNGTGVRILAFSTGNITCTGSGGTLFDSTSSTNLTVTGTPVVNIPYTGAVATTIAAFPATEAQSISFNIQAGTYALTMIDASRAYRNVNFTGFSGTLGALGASSVTIYGSLTLSSTMTLTPIANTLTFAGTSTGKTITTAGKIIGYKLAFNGVGASWILQDALTISGTSCNVRHYNGTLDLNGKTLTLAPEINSYFTDPGTKNLTFNGGTLIATNDFNNANPTGYTTTAGTGVGKISIQKATGFSFTGGGSTYNCTISNDGAGALSISGNNAIQTLTTTVGNITLTGSNTITTIANAVQPVTFTFAISTTQTITNWNVSGTAGNLVTIVSSSAGTAATLSKASGTVSANYLSLKDSAATGGAAWYAGANSINVSGNSGWIFTGPPAGNTGAFFFMF